MAHIQTYNGVSGTEHKRLDYILTRKSHRSRVTNVVVILQPVHPVKADSNHFMVVATVDLCGRFAHNRTVQTNPRQRQFSLQDLQVEANRRAVSLQFVRNPSQRLGGPGTTPEMARAFTESLLDAARTILPEEPRRRRARKWNEDPATRADLEEAHDKRREARRLCKGRQRNRATWRILKAACNGVAAAIAMGIYAHLDRYVTGLEVVYKDRDMRGLFEHLKKSVGVSGGEAGGQFITDDQGVLLRNKQDILKWWERFFDTILNTKSPP